MNEMWLCDLQKALNAIQYKIGHLGLVVSSVIGNYGNIVFTLSNGAVWIYIPQSEEIIEYEKS